MLPGQPVSLLGSCRDEHSPGVGVNMLGQHLLVQESEGNHQSPDQQQRVGPQIHQSIGVPRAGEQEGPGSRRSSSLPVSALRGTPASLPCWSQLSPSPHGTKPTKAQEQTVQDRSTICRETGQWSGPGHPSSELGGQAAPAETWASHWARGPWHTAPAVPHGTRTATEPTGLAVCPCLPLHGDTVYLAYYPMFAYKQGINQEERRAPKDGKGEARDTALPAATTPAPAGMGLSGFRDGSNWDGGPASPVPRGDQRRCPQVLCEESQQNERLEGGKSGQGELLISS